MKSHGILVPTWTLVAAALFCFAGIAAAQEAATSTNSSTTKEAQQNAPATSPILRLTLQDALALARKNSVQFQAAQTDAAIARYDRYQAAAILLPSVNYNNQALYTESNGPGNPVKYIAKPTSMKRLTSQVYRVSAAPRQLLPSRVRGQKSLLAAWS
jgi:hypothetical protein